MGHVGGMLGYGPYAGRRNEVFAWNGGYRYRGYGEIVVRHFLRPKEPLVHPIGDL